MASLGSTCSSSSSCWSMASLRFALPTSNRPPSRSHCLRFGPQSSSPGSSKLSSSSRNTTSIRFGSFSGLATLTPLLSLDSDISSFEQAFSGVNNGSRFYAMRHGKRVAKLNKAPDQRKALIRGLTTQLLKHGRIKTTRARASAIRKFVDKMITLAKDGSLHKRRQALGFIYEKQIVHALFAEVPERYGDRDGGYTRIIRTLPRRGDNAPMAYIELV